MVAWVIHRWRAVQLSRVLQVKGSHTGLLGFAVGVAGPSVHAVRFATFQTPVYPIHKV
ncbi:MAG: hypothetical protein ACKOPS_18665 [Cyanobium sp.]